MLELLVSSGSLPADDEGLLTYAAIGAAHRFWRNTEVEDWHAQPWFLSDGEMMRNNSAAVKLIRPQLSLDGTDWKSIAAQVTAGTRLLCDGRTLAAAVGQPRLRRLRRHAAGEAESLENWQDDDGPRQALLAAAVHAVGTRWHGAITWAANVEKFCAAVDDPTHSHWAHQPLPAGRPADTADTARLKALLLAGPDLLSAEAAEWCAARAMIGYI